ncbi:DUF4097 family beta strand repeat-containing protein [Natrinema salsiterrestre]|uniref:DUF4097 family beta strand repeat-containing protein n=1 Tax=Natrinema salsiterrestre TaxID=2950540 RepID=A0A9Q4Q036_9EURY|nr:DUF4097 family beta strand repeat-containing protein [Natrinema salsiterrestre]MDF9745289.1 DUF4097 family beta strand repeat-containing protein [Natrinema salsiterrestre]
MRSSISRRRALAGSGVCLLGSLAGCLATGRGESETVTETYDADDVDAVSLTTEHGSVAVAGTGSDAIEVHGHKAAPTEESLESMTMATSRDDGRLAVDARRGEEPPFLFGPDPKLDFEATVPDGTRVARAATVNGDIDARDVTGELDAETTNGNIDVRGVDGGLVAENTNGSVRVADVGGAVRAETTDGGIDVTLAGAGEGDLIAESTNGDVTVLAPPSLDATVSVSTANGAISVEGFDGAPAPGDGSLEMTLGQGTRSIRVETTNGGVTFRNEDEA